RKKREYGEPLIQSPPSCSPMKHFGPADLVPQAGTRGTVIVCPSTVTSRGARAAFHRTRSGMPETSCPPVLSRPSRNDRAVLQARLLPPGPAAPLRASTCRLSGDRYPHCGSRATLAEIDVGPVQVKIDRPVIRPVCKVRRILRETLRKSRA